jgi:hypothetical protein
MKIKTQDLTGPALDWAVATIEKLPKDVLVVVGGRPIVHRTFVNEIIELRCEFSAQWSQGGPIIERECINLKENGAGWWFAKIGDKKKDKWMRGTDPLMAAMRCFVASRLGDDVTVPDGLV